jgi:hypothetical protein
MPDIHVKIDSKVFDRALFAMQKQIPFAMARALTLTAQDCKTALVGHLTNDFTIRTTWLEQGMRIKSATKKNQAAEVGSIDPFMAWQEAGGTKESNNKVMGIPTEVIRGDDNRGIATAGKWPSRLVNSKKGKGAYFVGQFASGKRFVGRKTGAATPRQRVRAGRTGPVLPREPIEIVYRFADKVQIKPRWEFEKRILEVCDKEFADNALRAIDEVLRTAR